MSKSQEKAAARPTQQVESGRRDSIVHRTGNTKKPLSRVVSFALPGNFYPQKCVTNETDACAVSNQWRSLSALRAGRNLGSFFLPQDVSKDHSSFFVPNMRKIM